MKPIVQLNRQQCIIWRNYNRIIIFYDNIRTTNLTHTQRKKEKKGEGGQFEIQMARRRKVSRVTNWTFCWPLFSIGRPSP